MENNVVRLKDLGVGDNREYKIRTVGEKFELVEVLDGEEYVVVTGYTKELLYNFV